MAKQSYYKEAQAVLKQYKSAGYTTVKLNASREVLDEALRAIVKLHPKLDWETVFFYPETALEILKTVQVEEIKEQAKLVNKPISVGEAVKKIRYALSKAFPEIKFLVKREKKPGFRYTSTVFIGWYEGLGVAIKDVEEIAKAYHGDLTCTTWFNDTLATA